MSSCTALIPRSRGAGIACWLERRTRDRKVASPNPGRSEGRIFFSSQLCVLTLIRCPFHPVLPQLHIKGPGHSAKSAGGRLHLNSHTPLTQRSRSGLTMPLSRHGVGLTRNSSGNTRLQSSQLAKPLWTDPGVNSGISLRELISTLKKKEKKSAGGE